MSGKPKKKRSNDNEIRFHLIVFADKSGVPQRKKIGPFILFLVYNVVPKLVWIQKKNRLFNKLLKSKKHMIQLFSSWQFFSIARRLWSQSSKISGELKLLLLWLLQ